MKLCHLGGALSRAAASPHREEPGEVARAPNLDASGEVFRSPPFWYEPPGNPGHDGETVSLG